MKTQLFDENLNEVNILNTTGAATYHDVEAGYYYLKFLCGDSSSSKYDVTVCKINNLNTSTSENPLSIDGDFVLYNSFDSIFVSKTSNIDGFLKITATFQNPNHSAIILSPEMSNSSVYHNVSKYKYVKAGEPMVVEIAASSSNGYFTPTYMQLKTEILPLTSGETYIENEFPDRWTQTGPGVGNSTFKLSITEEGIYSIIKETLIVKYYPQPYINIYTIDGTRINALSLDHWHLAVGEYNVIIDQLPNEDGFRFKKVLKVKPLHDDINIALTPEEQQISVYLPTYNSTCKYHFTLTEASEVNLVLSSAYSTYTILSIYDSSGNIVMGEYNYSTQSYLYHLEAGSYYLYATTVINIIGNYKFKISATPYVS